MGRQIAPELAINEPVRKEKGIKGVFRFQRSEIQQIRTQLTTVSVMQMPTRNPASCFRAALGSQSLQELEYFCASGA